MGTLYFNKLGVKISKKEAVQKMLQTKGKIFTAYFIKRTTGEMRKMTCRTGVKKHLRGGELKFDPMSRGLFKTFDMQIEDYRFINLETLTRLRVGGIEYVVD